MIATYAIVLLLGTKASPAAAEEPAVATESTTSEAPPEQGARPLVVAVRGAASVAELRGALALRLPQRVLLTDEGPRPKATDFVEVTAAADGSLAFTLITAEGHAYDRTLAPEPEAIRAAAATIANLTFAIEAGTVEPDRMDVPQPLPSVEPEPEPEPAPAPAPVVPQPIIRPGPARPSPASPPPWELAPIVDLGVTVGLAPTTGADPLNAGHGRLGLDARRRRGGLLAAGVRVAGRSTHGLSLLRVRVDLGGGWAWRWRRAELLLAGAVTLEPWSLRDGNSRAVLKLGGDDASRRPLLGALVRLAPGARFQVGKRSPLFVRVGPRLELAASFVPQGGARTVDIARAEGDRTRSVMRIGGLEFVAGLELALWFPIGGR